MNKKPQQAQERARVILQVRSGQITAKEGARQLGISRKTYYQWEKRALQGMLSQLQEQPPGRPAKRSDPQLAAMQAKIQQLEAKLEIAQQTAEVRGILMQMQRVKDKADNKKKKNKSTRSSP
jgi:transposase-like protein